jgi:C-terminal processing protease CtpA/Prc
LLIKRNARPSSKKYQANDPLRATSSDFPSSARIDPFSRTKQSSLIDSRDRGSSFTAGNTVNQHLQHTQTMASSSGNRNDRSRSNDQYNSFNSTSIENNKDPVKKRSESTEFPPYPVSSYPSTPSDPLQSSPFASSTAALQNSISQTLSNIPNIFSSFGSSSSTPVTPFQPAPSTPSVTEKQILSTTIVKGKNGIGLDLGKDNEGMACVLRLKDIPGEANPAMICIPPVMTGDVIIAVNGKQTKSFMDTVNLIRAISSGNVSLTFIR